MLVNSAVFFTIRRVQCDYSLIFRPLDCRIQTSIPKIGTLVNNSSFPEVFL